MALPFHMTIKLESGELLSKGCCEIQGREDTILCYDIKHRIQIPIQRQTGESTGKRSHSPLTITKAYDRSSALLHSAQSEGKRLVEVKFEFYRIKVDREEKFYEIKLSNARIIEIKNSMSTDFEKKTEVLDYIEEVSFTYYKINWLYPDGGLEFEENWAVAL